MKQEGETVEFQISDGFDRKYVPVLLPDKAKLAYYIKEARGSERTMAQFAEACGTLSAPSFSRIIHGNLSKPLSVEIIKSIVTNAAPGADIDYDRIMRANGMVPEDVDNRRRMRFDEADYEYERELKNREISARNIVTDELFARGIMIQLVPPSGGRRFRSDDIPESRFKLNIPGSFALRLQGYEPKYWVFTYVSSDPVFRDGIRDFADLFLRDSWEPETLRDIRETFVFTDKEHYLSTVEKMKGIEVNSHISLLLTDTGSGKVTDEHILPRRDGQSGTRLFDLKRIF